MTAWKIGVAQGVVTAQTDGNINEASATSSDSNSAFEFVVVTVVVVTVSVIALGSSGAARTSDQRTVEQIGVGAGDQVVLICKSHFGFR